MSASFGTAFILVGLALFPSYDRPFLAAVLMFFYGLSFSYFLSIFIIEVYSSPVESVDSLLH